MHSCIVVPASVSAVGSAAVAGSAAVGAAAVAAAAAAAATVTAADRCPIRHGFPFVDVTV